VAQPVPLTKKLSSLNPDTYSMIKDWASTIGIPAHVVDSTDVGSFNEVIQSLYSQSLQSNNLEAVGYLERQVYRNRLREILS
jgi:hypothetical protein